MKSFKNLVIVLFAMFAITQTAVSQDQSVTIEKVFPHKMNREEILPLVLGPTALKVPTNKVDLIFGKPIEAPIGTFKSISTAYFTKGITGDLVTTYHENGDIDMVFTKDGDAYVAVFMQTSETSVEVRVMKGPTVKFSGIIQK